MATCKLTTKPNLSSLKVRVSYDCSNRPNAIIYPEPDPKNPKLHRCVYPVSLPTVAWVLGISRSQVNTLIRNKELGEVYPIPARTQVSRVRHYVSNDALERFKKEHWTRQDLARNRPSKVSVGRYPTRIGSQRWGSQTSGQDSLPKQSASNRVFNLNRALSGVILKVGNWQGRPAINLRGFWLASIGIHPGSKVRVTVVGKTIVIKPG